MHYSCSAILNNLDERLMLHFQKSGFYYFLLYFSAGAKFYSCSKKKKQGKKREYIKNYNQETE